MSKFVAPHPDLEAFTCAYCGVYAQQTSPKIHRVGSNNRLEDFKIHPDKTSKISSKQCNHCKSNHVFLVTELPYETPPKNFEGWPPPVIKKQPQNILMLYPKNSSAPPPQENMPEEVLALYKEAASIVSDSPSAACLLIRKALEVLLADLTNETNLNKMITIITEDVTKPWAKQLTPLLTSIRLIGNDAVHPREINRADNEQTALTLFSFLNICVDKLISQPLKTKQFLEANGIPV